MDSIEKAVSWWSKQLLGTKFSKGDGSPIGLELSALLIAAQDRRSISKEQITLFEKELSEYLKQQLSENPEKTIILTVDHYPKYPLSEIIKKSSLPSSLFPPNTTMWITTSTTEVSHGYGSPEQVL